MDKNSFVKLISSNGQEVLVQKPDSRETKLDINNLPAGVYIARIYNGSKIENMRFEKM